MWGRLGGFRGVQGACWVEEQRQGDRRGLRHRTAGPRAKALGRTRRRRRRRQSQKILGIARPFDGDLGLNAGQRSPVRGGEPQGVFRDLRASWTLRWTLPRKIERRRFVLCKPPLRDCKQGNGDERTQQRLRDEHRTTVSCLRLRFRLNLDQKATGSVVGLRREPELLAARQRCRLNRARSPSRVGWRFLYECHQRTARPILAVIGSLLVSAVSSFASTPS